MAEILKIDPRILRNEQTVWYHHCGSASFFIHANGRIECVSCSGFVTEDFTWVIERCKMIKVRDFKDEDGVGPKHGFIDGAGI